MSVRNLDVLYSSAGVLPSANLRVDGLEDYLSNHGIKINGRPLLRGIYDDHGFRTGMLIGSTHFDLVVLDVGTGISSIDRSGYYFRALIDAATRRNPVYENERPFVAFLGNPRVVDHLSGVCSEEGFLVPEVRLADDELRVVCYQRPRRVYPSVPVAASLSL